MDADDELRSRNAEAILLNLWTEEKGKRRTAPIDKRKTGVGSGTTEIELLEKSSYLQRNSPPALGTGAIERSSIPLSDRKPK